MIKYLLILLAIPQIAFAGAQYLLGDASEPAAENSLNCSYAAPASTVTLNNDDWKQYAETLAADVNEKASTEILPNYTLTNGGSVIRGSGIGVTYSWTGGTPTASGSAATYAYFSGSNLGFEWTIPATASEGTLKVYTRTYNGTNRFTVTLPGCTTYTADHTRTNSGENRVYTIAFSGQGNLVVRMELIGTGVMGVQAVTIDRDAAPPDVTLTGSSEEIPAESNLTTIGTTDWVMFGRSSVTDIDQMLGATAIPAYTRIGSSTLVRNVSTPKYSWSNGTPTATGTDITSRIVSPGDQTGFQWEIQAVEATRIVSVYVRAYKATGKFSASMTGATTYTEYLDTPLTGTGRVFRVSFSGTGTLTVRWETDGIETGGDCSLSAITLSTAGDDTPIDPPLEDEDIDYYASVSGGGDGSSESSPLTLAGAITAANAVSTAANPKTIGLLDGLTYTMGLVDLNPGVSLTSVSQDRTKVKITASAAASITSAWIDLKSTTPGSDGNQTISHISFDNGAYVVGMAVFVQNRNNVTVDNCAFTDIGAMNDVEYHYAFEAVSTQISKTDTKWYNTWPADPSDSNVAAMWPANPVENFTFTNNRVIGCHPLGIFHTKGAKINNNYIDNSAVHGWAIKSTCAFADEAEIGNNTFIGKQITSNTNWRVELWVHRNSRYHDNIMNGFYSITYGTHVEIDHNTITSPAAFTDYQTGIEANGLSHSIIHHNWVKDAGCGIRVGMFGEVNGPNWICENVQVYQNVVVNARNPQIRLQAVGATVSANHVTVRNFAFYNNALDATVVGRGLCGISLQQANGVGTCSLDDVEIKNNIITRQDYSSGYALIKTGTVTNIVATHNIMNGNNSNTASGITATNTLPASGSTTDRAAGLAYVKYVNAGADFNGYKIETDSPAKDSGTDTGITAIDAIKVDVLDRGAHEYGAD